MPKVKLAPNRPTPFAVKYCDAIDTQYGVELRFKGEVAGDDDAVLYAKFDAAVNALVDAGVLAGVPDLPDELPRKGYAITLKQKQLVFTAAQDADEKHPTLEVRVHGKGDAAAVVPRPGRVNDAVRTSATAAPPAADRKPLSTVYLECTAFVLDRVATKYQSAGLPLTPADCVAATATLFIQRSRAEGY